MGDFNSHPQFIRHQQEHNNLEQLMAKINALQQHMPTVPSVGILKNKQSNRLPPLNPHQYHIENNPSSKRLPLKTVSSENMKVVRHQPAVIDCHNQSPAPLSTVGQMYDLMKKHDQQLDFISRQIQQLLDLKTTTSNKPVMCSAETMTTNSLLVSNSSSKDNFSSPLPSTPAGQSPFRTTPSKSSASRRSVTMKIVDQERTTCLEQSVESPRFVANDEESRHEYYDFMISRIDHLLKHSDSEGDSAFDITPSPVKKPPCKWSRQPDSPVKSIGSETIYINRLARKYLVSDHTESNMDTHYARGVYRRKTAPQNGHNYLPPRSKNKTKSKLLDLDKLKLKPKFT